MDVFGKPISLKLTHLIPIPLTETRFNSLPVFIFIKTLRTLKNHCNRFIKWSKLEVENLPGMSSLHSFQVSEILNILEVENL